MRRKTLASIDEGGPDPSDPAAQVRLREIRDRLQGMSRGEVLRMLQQAGDSGDMELVRAIEDAPQAFPLAPSQDVGRMRQDRLARSHPEEVRKAQDQSAMAELLRSATTAAERQWSKAAQQGDPA